MGEEMSKLVSIVIPNYNSKKYIAKTLDSVISQTYTNWECIVVDDCSTDDSVEVIKEYQQKDKRIKLYQQEKNSGVANVRNVGIANAKGDYIALLDSDDLWTEDKIERQVELLENTGEKIAYCSYDFIDEKGNSIKRPFIVPKKTNFNKMLVKCVLSASTVLIDAELLKDHPFNPDFYHEDYVLWMQLLKIPIGAVGDKKVLMHYRISLNSRSHKKSNAAKQRWEVYRRVLHLSWVRSAFAFIGYAIRGVIKYYF